MTQFEFRAIVPLFNEMAVSPAANAGPPRVEESVPAPHPVRLAVSGVATTTPVGSVSVNVVLVNAAFKSLLRIVIVSVLNCPTKIVLGANPLLTEGGWTATTLRVALAGVVFVIETGVGGIFVSSGSIVKDDNSLAGMVLMRLPGVVEVTLTST